jgi:histone deacetylase 1/2
MAAMEKEIDNVHRMATWELIPACKCPVRPIGCKWVFKIKLDSNGMVSRYKARIVAKGYSEVLGEHYQADEVYSPVCSYNTLRIMLSIAVQRGWKLYQADVVGAYLLSELPQPQYMTMPPGFETYDDEGKPMVCKLRKGLYGTKSGGYHWNRTIDTFLRAIGFTQTTGDACLYILTDYSKGAPDGIGLMLCLYVDDISVAASTDDAYDWFITVLGERFPINSDETGNLEWILSMGIKYDYGAGTLKLTQTLAIERLCAVLGLERETRTPTTTPMTDRLPRVATREVPKEEFDYLSILGSVLHINMLTRPDISYAVSNLTRHASTPGRVHVRALKHLVRYLYDTRTIGITYHRNATTSGLEIHTGGVHPNTTATNHLQVFCDADYAMDYTRRSTSGMVIMLNGGPVAWSSALQKSTAQSTAESEIIAAADAAKWAVHARLMLQEMGAHGDEPVMLYEDNAACIAQGQQLRNRRAAKHYEVRLRFLQELIRDKIVRFVYCPTKSQLADSFTKPLDSTNFLVHRQLLLGV